MNLEPEKLLTLILMPLVKEVEGIVIKYDAHLNWVGGFDYEVSRNMLSFNDYSNPIKYKSEVLDKLLTGIKYDAEEKLMALKHLNLEIDESSIEEVLGLLKEKVKTNEVEEYPLFFKDAYYRIKGTAFVEHPDTPTYVIQRSIKEEDYGQYFHDELLLYANHFLGIIEELSLHLQFLLMATVEEDEKAPQNSQDHRFPEEVKKNVQDLIEKTKILEAINLLKKHALDEGNEEVKKSLVMLSYQLKKNEKNKLHQLVSNEAASLEENKIVSSLLSIIQ